MFSVQFAQKAVIQWQGKLLLVRKSMDDPHQPGRWEFPGGRMEDGETPDEALIREVREEVGLDVLPGMPLALWSWRLGKEPGSPTVVAVARLCEASHRDVTMSRHDAGDFIDTFGWFRRDEVLALDLIPDSCGPVAMAIGNLPRYSPEK
jgi:8-oxo-dGTP pyrophosphatase MutT (NUDIX family)